MLQPMHSRISSRRPSRILAGRNGIGDRRPGGADQIPGAAADDPLHQVGVGDPADPDDRLGSRLADAAGQLELPALREEAAGPGVERPLGDGADVDVPEVDQFVGHADELEPLLEVDAGLGAAAGDGDPAGHRAVRPDGAAHPLQRLQPESGPVSQRPAVLVVAPVVVGRQELAGQVGVGAVDVDDVEPGIPRELGRPHPVVLNAADVLPGHRLGDDPDGEVAGHLRGRQGRQPRLGVLAVDAGVRELDTGQRTVRVDGLGHHPQRLCVALVPHPGGDVRRLVGIARDGAVLGAHAAPAALRLDRPVGGLCPRLLDSETRAVRHLVEAVGQRHRADAQRLEEHVEAGIAGHQPSRRDAKSSPARRASPVWARAA